MLRLGGLKIASGACLEIGGLLKSQEWWFVGDGVARRRGRLSWMIRSLLSVLFDL